MEEPGGTRPECIDLHITGAPKEGPGGVHSAYGKDGGSPGPNGGTWRGAEGPVEPWYPNGGAWRGPELEREL